MGSQSDCGVSPQLSSSSGKLRRTCGERVEPDASATLLPIIEACRLKDEVDLEVRDSRIILSPVAGVRRGSEDAFIRMKEWKDDGYILKPVACLTSFEDRLQRSWLRPGQHMEEAGPCVGVSG